MVLALVLLKSSGLTLSRVFDAALAGGGAKLINFQELAAGNKTIRYLNVDMYD